MGKICKDIRIWYYADNYDLMKELFNAAMSEANYKQKKLLNVLFVHIDYFSLCCGYDKMEKGQVDNRKESIEKYIKLCNYFLDLSILQCYFILPDEPEYDKKPCKSWYGSNYITKFK